jgi:hypothetical protein
MTPSATLLRLFMGIEGFFGAFVAGIAVGAAKEVSPSSIASIQGFSFAFFIPIYFAKVGRQRKEGSCPPRPGSMRQGLPGSRPARADEARLTRLTLRSGCRVTGCSLRGGDGPAGTRQRQ